MKHQRKVFGRVKAKVDDKTYVFELKKDGLHVRAKHQRSENEAVLPFEKLLPGQLGLL